MSSDKLPSAWKRRYVLLYHKIQEWQLRERGVVYFGITKGLGGSVAELGHLDPDLTRRTLFGQIVDAERKNAILQWNLALCDLEDLREACEKRGVSPDELSKLNQQSPKWYDEFIKSMNEGRVFNPFEFISQREAAKLKKYLFNIQQEFRVRELGPKTTHDYVRRLLEGIPASSKREANSLWRAAVMLQPSLAKRGILSKNQSVKPPARPRNQAKRR